MVKSVKTRAIVAVSSQEFKKVQELQNRFQPEKNYRKHF